MTRHPWPYRPRAGEGLAGFLPDAADGSVPDGSVLPDILLSPPGLSAAGVSAGARMAAPDVPWPEAPVPEAGQPASAAAAPSPAETPQGGGEGGAGTDTLVPITAPILPVAPAVAPLPPAVNGVLRLQGGGVLEDARFEGAAGVSILSLGQGGWTVTLGEAAARAGLADTKGLFLVQAEKGRTASMDLAALPGAMTLPVWTLGSGGDDRIVLGATDDWLEGGAGRDTLIGGEGDDNFVFRPGQLGGDALVDGGAGRDGLRLLGGAGIAAGDLANVRDIEGISTGRADRDATFDLTDAAGAFTGRQLRLTLNAADTGTHTVRGPADAAGFVFKGGAGVDHVTGIAGPATLTGRGGADVFSAVFAAPVAAPYFTMTITDFVVGEDRLAVAAHIQDGEQLAAWTDGAEYMLRTAIDTAEGLLMKVPYRDFVLLKGVTRAQLSFDDFVDAAAPVGLPVTGHAVTDAAPPVLSGGEGMDRLVVAAGGGAVLEDSFFAGLDGFEILALDGAPGGSQGVVAGAAARAAFGASSTAYLRVEAAADSALSFRFASEAEGAPLDIRGSARGDSIAGTARDDVIRGGDGDDRIEGGGGRDLLDGGAGDDVFVFHAGDIRGQDGAGLRWGRVKVEGGPGTDTLLLDGVNFSASNQDEDFGQLAGHDLELVRLAPAERPYRLYLSDGEAFTDGAVVVDASAAGPMGATLRVWNAQAVTLVGSEGDDFLAGNAAGPVTMTGGAGADRFVLEYRTGTGRVVVTDFEDGVDLLALDVEPLDEGWQQVVLDSAVDTPEGLLLAQGAFHGMLLPGMTRAQFGVSDLVLFYG